MATVNAMTLDKVKRTHFFRVNQEQVPVQLPFDLVTLDSDLQYYEPRYGAVVNDKGQRLRGESAGVVYLDRNQALPRPNPQVRGGLQVVWEYHGV